MVDGAPLYTLRRLFGALVIFSTLRFIYYGWIDCQILSPIITFPYEEFSFLPRPNHLATTLLFIGMLLGGFSIMTGKLFKIGTTLFFLCFTYIELLDKTYYLNHYYFVSIIAFLLIFTDAHKERCRIPKLQVNLFKFMIGLVYFLAGLAKLNSDWMIDAQPLSLWLPPHADMPFIGWFFKYKITAYVFSWGGALFDLSAPFFLMSNRFRIWFFPVVILFHLMTWLLFPIGIFPWVMICCATIFFTSEEHRKFWSHFKLLELPKIIGRVNLSPFFKVFAVCFLIIQILFPFRYLMYPGNLFWHESGYRFSWRVMLIEKPSFATFYIKDEFGIEEEVNLSDWLTKQQEKMVSSQPDMIVQFAHILKEKYLNIQQRNIKVRAEVWSSLNGRRSQLLIDPYRNLAQVKNNWKTRDYVIPFDSVITPQNYYKINSKLRENSSW